MRGAQVIITLIKIKNKNIYILKKGVEHVNLVCVRERERERERGFLGGQGGLKLVKQRTSRRKCVCGGLGE